MNDLKIEKWDLAKLKPYAGNAKDHPASQVEGIARSITEFGFNDPIAVDEDGVIIEGHGRLMAAEKLGLQQIPVIQLKHMTEEQKRAYIIAHNKLTINSGFDLNILPKELEALSGLDFDLSLTGFNEDELSKLFKTVNEPEGDPDEIPEVPDKPVTVMGDLYEIGPHRLLCGDSTVVTDVDKLLGQTHPNIMMTDPPYGVKLDQSWRDNALKRKLGGENKNLVQNDDKADWTETWQLFNGNVAYIWHASKYSDVIMSSLRNADFEPNQQLIWNKKMLVMGRNDYHFKHQPCWYAIRKGKTHDWISDRKQTTVIDAAAPNAIFGRSKEDKQDKTEHPTQKPIACMELVRNHKGDVYDPFGGSGSTMVASHQHGKKASLMELDPKYCDVIIKRMAHLFPDLKIKRNGKAFNLKQEAQ